MKCPCLATIYFYELDDSNEYCLTHDNILIYAENFADAARQIEEGWPEAERMDITLYQEGTIFVSDGQMPAVREILKEL